MTGNPDRSSGSLDSQPESRVAIGPSSTARVNGAMSQPYSAVLTAPLGIERLLVGRLRAWVGQLDTCPKKIVAYGSAVGDLAHAAFADVDRVVHRAPPVDARLNCARTAIEHWRTSREGSSHPHGAGRSAIRSDFGLSERTIVVMAAGDRADSIDAREAFAAVGRAALAGADVALIVPRHAKWSLETMRYARRAGLSDCLVVIDDAEIPSALWLAVDLMLLQRPGDEGVGGWWGWCGWWGIAAGIPIIHESCFPNCEGSIRYERGDRNELVRLLIELSENPSRNPEFFQALSAGAIRSASAAASGREPSRSTSESGTQRHAMTVSA